MIQSKLVAQRSLQSTTPTLHAHGLWVVNARGGSKQWWTLSRELLSQQAKVQSIPALKSEDGTWMYEPASKADLLAGPFSAKSCIPEPVENEYRVLELHSVLQKMPPDPTQCGALAVLSSLDEHSGTGPDLLRVGFSSSVGRAWLILSGSSRC